MDLDLESADWGPVVDSAGDVLRVLDAGCGEAGYHGTLKSAVETLAGEEGYTGEIEVWGLDAEPAAVESARENNQGNGFRYVNETLEPGKGYTPFDGDFDLVVSQHLLCEVGDPEAVYSEVRRLGKGAGPHNQIHSRC